MNRYIIILLVVGTIFFIVLAFGIIAYLIIQKRKQNGYGIEREILVSHHHKTLLDERERTMCEIASELHDNTAQELSMARRILADTMEFIIDQFAIKQLVRTSEILAEIADQLNYLGHSLSNAYLENLGFISAISKELEYLSSSGKLHCEVNLVGKYNRPEFEKELLIYRICQEAIHNTLKHAQASQLKMSIHCWERKIIVELSDNGKGCATKPAESFGIGINNMQQRAKLLNGKLEISSIEGKGFNVKLQVPL